MPTSTICNPLFKAKGHQISQLVWMEQWVFQGQQLEDCRIVSEMLNGMSSHSEKQLIVV